MCTDKELVFLHRGGNYIRIHTGVRHETWMNKWKIVPLAGGSKSWARKLKFMNLTGLASIAGAAILNLMPIWGMLSLSMGTKASLSAVLSIGMY